ncbi:HAD hydrolase-like protein [Saccharibacter sp. 17.LH.SD]|uniref:HAD family hydrolase n=1 Tax=Saccharibacter sp. 17.LH.SD TaxID=2689393 RepID=UPI001367DF7E|nr:HAD family hydrolase [Saccharibacter sp. 17.LH.SD]MXV44014.1 HAD hydrolase-like protein [Saccharibacter sp. 17.LH.SD]
MSRFPVLLLDYDGTLAETRPAILTGLISAFKEQGFHAPSREELEFELEQGRTLEDFCKEMAPEISPEKVLAFARSYRHYYTIADEKETVLFDGVKEILEALTSQGHKLVLLSNKYAPSLESSVKRFDLGKWFVTYMGAEEGKPRKPQKEVLTERIRPFFPDTPLSDFLIVGDTTADLLFAQNAGISSCWVSYGHGSAASCEALRPNYHIDRLSELLKIVV